MVNYMNILLVLQLTTVYTFLLVGKNYLQWYGGEAQLVVSEQELIKEILNNRDRAFPKTDIDSYAKKLLGDGLLTTKGEKWGKLRKLANYAFHGESLKVSF